MSTIKEQNFHTQADGSIKENQRKALQKSTTFASLKKTGSNRARQAFWGREFHNWGVRATPERALFLVPASLIAIATWTTRSASQANHSTLEHPLDVGLSLNLALNCVITKDTTSKPRQQQTARITLVASSMTQVSIAMCVCLKIALSFLSH